MDAKASQQTLQPTDARPASLPPWPVLALAAVVALLRALPFLWTRVAPPDPGNAWLGVPYIPKDWLAYLALVGQEPWPGERFLADPFTTDPQGGRFILVLHQLLNAIRRLTGADPAWLLELARTVLVFAFAVVLWRFLADVLRSDRTRAWAVALALGSGGLAFVVLAATAGSVAPLALTASQDLWSMYGWTTFESLYNPLWIAGMVLLLVVLGPLLRPGGPRSAREIGGAAAALVALWFTHPYSAIAAVAIVAAAVAAEWTLTGAFALRRAARIAAAVVPALGVAGLVSLWQLRDPVFRQTSGALLGPLAAPVFWYPVAFGALGAFALAGWAGFIRAQNPWRYAIGAWVVGIALLHASTVVNGYHFVPYVHLPLAILAAGPVERFFARARWRGAGAVAWRAAVAALLVANAGWSVARAVREVKQFQLPRDVEGALAALAALPPGNVLCEEQIGNVVPADGKHRVYVGQWFMTPDFQARAERVARALQPDGLPVLRDLVSRERIDYLLVPAPVAFAVTEGMPDLGPRVEQHGSMSVVRFTRRGGR